MQGVFFDKFINLYHFKGFYVIIFTIFYAAIIYQTKEIKLCNNNVVSLKSIPFMYVIFLCSNRVLILWN